MRKVVIASALLLLASCKAEPPPARQVQFVPPPPSKPTDRAPVCGRPKRSQLSRRSGYRRSSCKPLCPAVAMTNTGPS